MTYNGYFRNQIGRAIYRGRTSEDWTQKDLAKRLGISASYVSQLELGKLYPSQELKNRLMNVFGTNFE